MDPDDITSMYIHNSTILPDCLALHPTRLHIYGSELFCQIFNKIMAITNGGFLQRSDNQILQTLKFQLAEVYDLLHVYSFTSTYWSIYV